MKPRHPGMGDMGMPLGLVRLLPTPRTSDTSGTGAHGDGGPDLRTAVALLPAHAQPPSSEGATSSWGPYAAAVERWEALTRPAPQPVDERDRLNPAFVEWLMGLAEHHVTGVDGLSRAAQLKALGNGVVPQQAAAALRLLLDRFDQPHAVSCGHWAGATRHYCHAIDGVRRYLTGYRCPAHTPAALAGRPEAPGSPTPLRRRTVEPRRHGLGVD